MKARLAFGPFLSMLIVGSHRSRGLQNHYRLPNCLVRPVSVYLIMFLSPLLLIKFLCVLFLLILLVICFRSLQAQLIEKPFLNHVVLSGSLVLPYTCHIRTWKQTRINFFCPTISESRLTFKLYPTLHFPFLAFSDYIHSMSWELTVSACSVPACVTNLPALMVLLECFIGAQIGWGLLLMEPVRL